jgi:hypothetical protein
MSLAASAVGTFAACRDRNCTSVYDAAVIRSTLPKVRANPDRTCLW